MNHFNRIAARRMCVLALLCVAGACAANAQTPISDGGRWPTCTYTPPVEEQQSGPNFTVRVSFREQPIVGVKVILSLISVESEQNVGEVIATNSTDSNGIAHFFAIRSGIYRAHVDKALLAENKEIQVEANNTSENRVEIEWPSSPIVTGNLRGRIFSWQKSSPQNSAELLPHKNVFVQLLDLRSGKPLASVHTDTEGYYEFPSYRDGSYVMRVGEHTDPSINNYDNAVEVAKDVTQGNMPDLIVDEVCGNGMVEIMDRADARIAASLATNQTK